MDIFRTRAALGTSLVFLGMSFMACATPTQTVALKAPSQPIGSAADKNTTAASNPQTAAVFQTLTGETVDLAAEIKGHRATLLIWISSTCPCVLRYQERMHQLRETYGADEVAVFAVASNSDDKDAQRLQEIMLARGFTLPILQDASGRLADTLKVRSTPTAVVLDSNADIQFRGWIDNERLPGEAGRVPYVEHALEAALGRRPKAASASPVYGCRITRSLFQNEEPAQCAVPEAKTTEAKTTEAKTTETKTTETKTTETTEELENK